MERGYCEEHQENKKPAKPNNITVSMTSQNDFFKAIAGE